MAKRDIDKPKGMDRKGEKMRAHWPPVEGPGRSYPGPWLIA